jgi:hypothetical protein
MNYPNHRASQAIGIEVVLYVYLKNPQGYQVGLESGGEFSKNLQKMFKVIDNESSAAALKRKAELLQAKSFLSVGTLICIEH